MPTNLAASPKLLKGALVIFETKFPVPTNLIVFQYNPEKMTRKLEQQAQPSDPQQTTGDTNYVLPPTESFSVSIELDATDQLAESDALASTVGLHPVLAALDLLLYPPSSTLLLGKAMSAAGLALVAPSAAPLVLFVWGPARVVPVRVTSMSVTEQAFDANLNPIRAQVELGLRSLNQKELDAAGLAFSALEFLRQLAKEGLARTNVVSAADQVTRLLPF